MAEHFLNRRGTGTAMATIGVKSEVAGTVWRIEKAVGEAVAEGEIIMILESMKMEIPVHSPGAGRVTEIAVALEEAVEEDQVLCRIDG